MLGLYLHIPFCAKLCDYCDFFAISAPEKLYLEYLTLVLKEISVFSERHPHVLERVETMYVGGGTPSILPPELLDRLFSSISAMGVPLKKLREFSMEFNPESCDAERLSVAMGHGVNRASIGIQTFHQELLDRIGRRQTVRSSLNALDLLMSKNDIRVNADLMFNLPGQTLDVFLQDLNRLSDFPLGHISFYGLKVDPESMLGHRIKRGELSIDEDLYAPMYKEGVKMLSGKGFDRYETSNFAKPCEESLHNLNYWRRGEYLAFGPGAHGFFEGERFCAPEMYARWRDYVVEGLPRESLMVDKVGPEECMAEYIQLSLRTKYGMQLDELKKLGYAIRSSSIEKWVEKGFLANEDGCIKLVGDGWIFMDRVVEELYCNCFLV